MGDPNGSVTSQKIIYNIYIYNQPSQTFFSPNSLNLSQTFYFTQLSGVSKPHLGPKTMVMYKKLLTSMVPTYQRRKLKPPLGLPKIWHEITCKPYESLAQADLQQSSKKSCERKHSFLSIFIAPAKGFRWIEIRFQIFRHLNNRHFFGTPARFLPLPQMWHTALVCLP